MVLALFVKAKQIAPYFSPSVGIMSTDSKNKKQTNNKKTLKYTQLKHIFQVLLFKNTKSDLQNFECYSPNYKKFGQQRVTRTRKPYLTQKWQKALFLFGATIQPLGHITRGKETHPPARKLFHTEYNYWMRKQQKRDTETKFSGGWGGPILKLQAKL